MMILFLLCFPDSLCRLLPSPGRGPTHPWIHQSVHGALFLGHWVHYRKAATDQIHSSRKQAYPVSRGTAQRLRGDSYSALPATHQVLPAQHRHRSSKHPLPAVYRHNDFCALGTLTLLFALLVPILLGEVLNFPVPLLDNQVRELCRAHAEYDTPYRQVRRFQNPTSLGSSTECRSHCRGASQRGQ